MSETQRAEIDRMLEAGDNVTQGVPPDLSGVPAAGFYAQLWSDLRASTPGDHPISLPSMALMVGQRHLPQVRPVIQEMDRAYFRWNANRREAERKRSEAKAKQARGAGRRGRR